MPQYIAICWITLSHSVLQWVEPAICIMMEYIQIPYKKYSTYIPASMVSTMSHSSVACFKASSCSGYTLDKTAT